MVYWVREFSRSFCGSLTVIRRGREVGGWIGVGYSFVFLGGEDGGRDGDGESRYLYGVFGCRVYFGYVIFMNLLNFYNYL